MGLDPNGRGPRLDGPRGARYGAPVDGLVTDFRVSQGFVQVLPRNRRQTPARAPRPSQVRLTQRARLSAPPARVITSTREAGMMWRTALALMALVVLAPAEVGAAATV